MHNLVLFDTETTGLGAEDRIISLALQKYKEPQSALAEFFSIGGQKIPLEAKSVHHITEKKLEGKQPLETYKEFLEGYFANQILVAHNAKFDLKMLKQEGIRVPTIKSSSGREQIPHICTMKVAQSVCPGISQYKLQFLRYYFEIEGDFNPHDAYDDVRILEEVFTKLFNKVDEVYGITISVGGDSNTAAKKIIEKMMNLSINPVLLEKMPLGKHKGSLFSDVDTDYLLWCVQQDWMGDENNENLFYTIQNELDKRQVSY